MKTLIVLIVKPTKYERDGRAQRFLKGFMPNGAGPYILSMIPEKIGDCEIKVFYIDEYVQTDLEYLKMMHKGEHPILLLLVGVQSHQFHRALDLAAYALEHGTKHVVIGGPHIMTCDTSEVQGRGVSFALSEAESVLPTILRDAIQGELQSVYGADQRWTQGELNAPVLRPPSRRDLKRYILPMAGIYPARGCPFTCNFCSVIKIAGRQIRSQPVITTIDSLRALKKGGVKFVMFTSDNFNKYADAPELLKVMIADPSAQIPFFVQCDTQVAKNEAFVELLSRAGCFQMFVGVESFSRKILLAAHKAQNHPEAYAEIIRLCRKYKLNTHFSNMIGFPDQTRQDIAEHRAVLQSLDPDLGSFFILCPIPGTEQYAEFLESGVIYERNLDRFDATCPTWHHNQMSPKELQNAMFECYRKFYSLKHIAATTLRCLNTKGLAPDIALEGIAQLFQRYCASRKMHPMSGGVGRVRRDGVEDYRELRRKRYDLDLVTLPKNLELSPADDALNRRVNIAV